MDTENKDTQQFQLPTRSKVDEVLDTLNPEQKEVIMQEFACIKQESFSGPLPPPNMLKAYGDIIPDAPQRILTMAENQSNHRMKCEKSIIDSSKFESFLGQILGFIIAVLSIGASVYLGINGHDKLAIAIPASVATLAAVFVINRKKSKDGEKGE